MQVIDVLRIRLHDIVLENLKNLTKKLHFHLEIRSGMMTCHARDLRKFFLFRVNVNQTCLLAPSDVERDFAKCRNRPLPDQGSVIRDKTSPLGTIVFLPVDVF